MSRTARSPRRVKTSVAAVLAAALTLSGCAAGMVSQTADQVGGVHGSNATVGDIGLRNIRFVTPEGASFPAGSDARLVFYVSNDGLTEDTLTGITVPVAGSVEITGDAVLPAQKLTAFTEESKTVITAKALTEPLQYGTTVPVTFSFAKAGQVTTNVPVEGPAERTGERETIAILPPHPTPLWEEGHEGEH